MKKLKNILMIGFLGLFLVLAQPTTAADFRKALADVNRDQIVSILDKELVKANFGNNNPAGTSALADVNQDGLINGLDLSLVTRHIGETVSYCQIADLDNDGQVTILDIGIIGGFYFQKANSLNMAADLNGDGMIDIGDLSKAGGVYLCYWQ